MIKCKVIKKDNDLFVVIPKDIKITDWMEYNYHIKGDYTGEDIELPTRKAIVTITKPVIQKTQMGIIQNQEIHKENWVYFDIPYKSFLIEENDEIELELETKPLEQLTTENGKEENVLPNT